jgi:hypothetical protein
MANARGACVLSSAVVLGVAACGGGGVEPTTPNEDGLFNPPAPTSFAIFPAQVVTGVIDLNGGQSSRVNPWTTIGVCGSVVSGYSWTTTPGFAAPHPAISITPLEGIISGSSTTLQQGTFTMRVTATDGSGVTRDGSVTIDLTSTCSSNPAALNPCSTAMLSNQHRDYLPSGTINRPYAASVVTSGGQPPYAWAHTSGTMPPGITLDTARGVLRGTPTSTGTFTFSIRSSDSSTPAQNDTSSFTLRVVSSGGGCS